MKKTITLAFYFQVLALVSCVMNAQAQIQFTNSNHLIATATHSGCAVTVVDINNDGLDDLVKMDQSEDLVIDLQNQDGSFTNYNLGNITGTNRVWGMAVADVDHNGWKDIFTGTNGECYMVKISWTGSTLAAVTTVLAANYFTQNITLGDFNNDGWVDLFVCDDVDYPKIYMNDGAGNLPILAMSFDTQTIASGPKSLTVSQGLSFTVGQTVQIGFDGANYMTADVTSYNAGTGDLGVNVIAVQGSGTYSSWSVHPTVVLNTNMYEALSVGGDPYDSGNYGSTWTDFDNDGDLDLYIAHCRQSASSTNDIRRRDRIFVNDGNNGFTEAAQAYGIEVSTFLQTWTTSFGDIDNDGDLDMVMTNHGVNGQILENNGTGHYTDITTSAGFSTLVNGGMDPIESTFEDFDNDGFLDILVTGGGSGDSYVLYHNNGNRTFTLLETPIPPAGHSMLSFATGDLNHDGRTDLFASYGNVYNSPSGTADVLYLNTSQNNNHFITFNLTGTASNVGAVGARVRIYGPWGVQVREVRAGDSYGTSNSMQMHFGLGVATTVDSVRIDWPSHQQSHFYNLQADQFVTAVEGGCNLTGNIVQGPYVFCTGQTLTLTAASGFSSYLWSNGMVGQSVNISATDTLNVYVTNVAGCDNISATIVAQMDPDQTPVVTASSSEFIFCQGDSVVLTSSPAASYLWSNGASTQSIAVTQTGIYTVTTQGDCALWTSAADSIDVFPAPAPSTTNASLVAPGTATLTATGNNIYWYAAPTGGTPIDSGFSYQTAFLNNDTVFYAQDRYAYGGRTDSTGIWYHSGTTYSANTTNSYLIFDVEKPCVLKSVKVYTDTPGLRIIELRNSSNAVLQSLMVNIPIDTSVITLNFNLTPGTDYQLGTNTAQNQSSFGFDAPRLRRNTLNISYPYTINNLVSITSSDFGSTRYYYFYNWQVEELPTVCVSDRTPAFVDLVTGIQNITDNSSFRLFPNPATGLLNILFEKDIFVATRICIVDVTGREILRKDFPSVAGGQAIQINTGSLAAGTYLLQVSNASSSSSQRFSVVK